jgi:hypothetical protein
VIVSDSRAAKIAYDWHGGGGSKLYSFASTGTIAPGLMYEINQDIERETKPGSKERRELLALRSYVEARRARGPVEGWYQTVWGRDRRRHPSGRGERRTHSTAASRSAAARKGWATRRRRER